MYAVPMLKYRMVPDPTNKIRGPASNIVMRLTQDVFHRLHVFVLSNTSVLAYNGYQRPRLNLNKFHKYSRLVTLYTPR